MTFSRFLDVLIDYENRYGESYIPRDRLGFGPSRDEDEDLSDDIVIDEEEDSATWTTSRRHSHSHGGCGSSARRPACCSDDEYDEEEENHQRMVGDAITAARIGRILRLVDRGMDIAARRR